MYDNPSNLMNPRRLYESAGTQTVLSSTDSKDFEEDKMSAGFKSLCEENTVRRVHDPDFYCPSYSLS